MNDEKTSGTASEENAAATLENRVVTAIAGVTVWDGKKATLVFDDGAPVRAVAHVLGGAISLELDQADDGAHEVGRPKVLHLRPELLAGALPLPPAPGGDSFEESMKHEQEKTKAWIVDLLETVAPRVKELFGRPVNAETPVMLSEVYRHIEERIESEIQDYVDAMEVRVFDKLKQLFAGKGELAAAATSQPQTKTTPAPAARPNQRIAYGDQVKVWTSTEKNTFRLGVVKVVHDGGHSFDVQLDDGSISHVQADGLELDELAS